MSATKTVVTVSSVALALMFGGGVLLMMNLGGLAKSLIERIATDTLGVPVSIASLDISFQDKRALLKGLSVGNPEGFETPHALRVEAIEIVLGNISKGLIVLEKIDVQGTNINLEVTPNGTNLNAIKDYIQTTHAKNNMDAPPTEGAPDKKSTKVIIGEMNLTKASLTPSMVLFKAQNLKPVTIPDIRLTGIGEKENGLLIREAIAQVWTQISKKASAQAGKSGFYQGLSKDKLKDIGVSSVRSMTDQLGGDVKDLKKDLKTLKGLFGQ